MADNALISSSGELSRDIKNDLMFIEMFLRNHEEGSAGTVRVYRTEIQRFLTFINYPQIKLAEVTAKICLQYKDELKGYYKRKNDLALTPYSDATKARKLNTISSLYRFGMEIGYFKFNPMKAIRKPVPDNELSHKFLLEDEIYLLFDALKNKNRLINYLMCIMLIKGGFRISELTNIRWGNFYQDHRGNIGVKIIKSKGNKFKVVKITRDVWSYIVEYRIQKGLSPELDSNDNSYLFTTKNGKPISDRQFRDTLNRAAKRAGLSKKISPHWLRHTSATLAVMGKVDIRKLMDQFGWSSIKTAQRYIHSTNQLNDTAADHINIKI